MIAQIQETRAIVVKHIMQRVCANEIGVSAGLRLIAAFDIEYQLVLDSFERYQRTCYQITDGRSIVVSGG